MLKILLALSLGLFIQPNMSIVTWGLLAKSEIDNETIEDAIARLIAVHNADETAHLGAGEALQSHKSDTVIDHPAGSVVGDKIEEGAEIHVSGSFDRYDFHWFCLFESLTGLSQILNGTGAITLTGSYAQLATGATQYSYLSLYKVLDISNVFSWDRKRKFRTRVYFSANTSQLLYFAFGNTQNIDLTRYIGFKIDNGDIYAGVCNGSDETLTDTGVNVSAGSSYDFEIIFTPGVDAKFYINDTLVATITTNLPSGATDANYLMTTFLRTMAAADKQVRFSYWDVWQDTE